MTQCHKPQNARALALHLLPGHSRYCRGIPVVGLDDQIRNSRRAAGVANHDAGMANHETLRVAHKERDRSLSIARGPLRAWRVSAPARRRGTRAEYERESVNVTSVCGTTCERGGASLGATARVGKSQVAALCCGTRSRRACSRSRRASSRARLARIAPDAARSSASRKSARSSVG